jgi:hypothetical protein
MSGRLLALVPYDYLVYGKSTSELLYFEIHSKLRLLERRRDGVAEVTVDIYWKDRNKVVPRRSDVSHLCVAGTVSAAAPASIVRHHLLSFLSFRGFSSCALEISPYPYGCTISYGVVSTLTTHVPFPFPHADSLHPQPSHAFIYPVALLARRNGGIQ